MSLLRVPQLKPKPLDLFGLLNIGSNTIQTRNQSKSSTHLVQDNSLKLQCNKYRDRSDFCSFECIKKIGVKTWIYSSFVDLNAS